LSLPRPTHAEQGSAPLLSALAFFFVMTSYYIIRPVRDQLSGAVGSSALPLFFFATFIVMLLLTPVFGALVARFPRRQLLTWVYSFFVVCLLAFVPAFLMQERIGARVLGVVFYVWVSVFNLFVVSLFWSFMADIFNSGSARRVFSLIALGGMAGAIFGPMVTSVLVRVLGVAPLLAVSAIMLSASLIFLLKLSTQNEQRANSTAGEAIGGSLWAGLKELWSRPFLRYMAILMLLGDGIGTLAYALVADYSKAHFHDNALRTAFYNDIDLTTNLLGAAMQLTITRWLLTRHGAGWGLVVPAMVNTLLLAAVMVFGLSHFMTFQLSLPRFSDMPAWLQGHQVGTAMYGLSVLTIMLVITRGFAYGMTKPAVDALYTRVPREPRYKGKNFIETAVWRFGDVLVTTGVSGLGKLGMGVAGMAAIGTAVSAVATWFAQRAGHSPDLLPETPSTDQTSSRPR
jgi:ATP:ADP antiporter, AAA family